MWQKLKIHPQKPNIEALSIIPYKVFSHNFM